MVKILFRGDTLPLARGLAYFCGFHVNFVRFLVNILRDSRIRKANLSWNGQHKFLYTQYGMAWKNENTQNYTNIYLKLMDKDRRVKQKHKRMKYSIHFCTFLTTAFDMYEF